MTKCQSLFVAGYINYYSYNVKKYKGKFLFQTEFGNETSQPN